MSGQVLIFLEYSPPHSSNLLIRIHKHKSFASVQTFKTKVWSSSMSLEEKFEALMKSYQSVLTSNRDVQWRLEETEG